jgi:predicted transcriptional regulator of viral defense system
MQEQSKLQPDLILRVVTDLGGIARTSEILRAEVHPRELYAAREDGTLVEVSRGLFRLASLPMTEPDLIIVASRMPTAQICLVSALHLHGLTRDIPRAVHVALPRGRHPARLEAPPIEVFHFAAASYETGVEIHTIDGLELQVTTPAKSVADAFKFRSRVGLETALDALRQTLAQGAATPAELFRMAAVNRVESVMRPYLEALT